MGGGGWVGGGVSQDDRAVLRTASAPQSREEEDPLLLLNERQSIKLDKHNLISSDSVVEQWTMSIPVSLNRCQHWKTMKIKR